MMVTAGREARIFYHVYKEDNQEEFFLNGNKSTSLNYHFYHVKHNKNTSQSKRSILFLKWQSQEGNTFLEYSDFVKQTKDEIVLHKW